LGQWRAVLTAQDERTAFGSGVDVLFNFNRKSDLRRSIEIEVLTLSSRSPLLSLK
jgi:hypothetical protein